MFSGCEELIHEDCQCVFNLQSLVSNLGSMNVDETFDIINEIKSRNILSLESIVLFMLDMWTLRLVEEQKLIILIIYKLYDLYGTEMNFINKLLFKKKDCYQLALIKSLQNLFESLKFAQHVTAAFPEFIFFSENKIESTNKKFPLNFAVMNDDIQTFIDLSATVNLNNVAPVVLPINHALAHITKNKAVSLMDVAALCGSIKIMKFFLINDFSISTETTCWAAASGNIEIFRLLLNHGAEITQDTLVTAQRFYRYDLAKWIFENSETKLHFSEGAGNVQVFAWELLVHPEQFSDYQALFDLSIQFKLKSLTEMCIGKITNPDFSYSKYIEQAESMGDEILIHMIEAESPKRIYLLIKKLYHINRSDLVIFALQKPDCCFLPGSEMIKSNAFSQSNCLRSFKTIAEVRPLFGVVELEKSMPIEAAEFYAENLKLLNDERIAIDSVLDYIAANDTTELYSHLPKDKVLYTNHNPIVTANRNGCRRAVELLTQFPISKSDQDVIAYSAVRNNNLLVIKMLSKDGYRVSSTSSLFQLAISKQRFEISTMIIGKNGPHNINYLENKSFKYIVENADKSIIEFYAKNYFELIAPACIGSEHQQFIMDYGNLSNYIKQSAPFSEPYVIEELIKKASKDDICNSIFNSISIPAKGFKMICDKAIEVGFDLSTAKHDDKGLLDIAYDLKKDDIVKILLQYGCDCFNAVVFPSKGTEWNEMMIKYFYENNIKINANLKDEYKNTSLVNAASAGFAEACSCLIKMGANWRILSRSGDSILHLGFMKRIHSILIDAGVDVNLQDKLGTTILMSAVKIDMYDEVNKLLNGTLLEACPDNFKYLINNPTKIIQADVNQRNGEGMTPIFYVKSLSVLNLLVQHGAEINITDNNGFSPLVYAAGNGNYDVCKELIERGTDPTQITPDGASAFSNSVIHRFTRISVLLCPYISTPTSYELWAIAKFGNKELVNLMIECGISPQKLLPVRCYDNDSILWLLEELAKYDIDFDISDPETGDTALISVINSGSEDEIEFLLNNGASTTKANANGATPLFVALCMSDNFKSDRII